MHKVIQLIFKLFVKQKHVLFYENMCSLGDFNEKPKHRKISKSYFFNHLAKQLCSMCSKCLTLVVGHMCKK